MDSQFYVLGDLLVEPLLVVVEVRWHHSMVGPDLSYSPLEKWSMPSLEKGALIVSAAIIGGGRCSVMLAHVLVGLVL